MASADKIFKGYKAVEFDGNFITRALTCDSFTASGLITATGGLSSASAIVFPQRILTGTAGTVAATDFSLYCNADALALPLPAIASNLGRILALKQVKAGGTFTITGNAAETIDGAGTLTLQPLKGVLIQATASGWFKIGSI